MYIYQVDFAIYFLFAKPTGCVPINFYTYKVESCGNVTFHYPFRMKDQDDPNDWFKVTCNEEKVPLLNISGTNLQILDFDFLDGTVMVNHQ